MSGAMNDEQEHQHADQAEQRCHLVDPAVIAVVDQRSGDTGTDGRAGGIGGTQRGTNRGTYTRADT